MLPESKHTPVPQKSCDEIAREHGYRSLADMMAKLGEPEKMCRGLLRSWGYQPPTDPEQQRRHALNGSHYEYVMRGLIQDLAQGRITQEQFDTLATQAQEKKLF